MQSTASRKAHGTTPFHPQSPRAGRQVPGHSQVTPRGLTGLKCAPFPTTSHGLGTWNPWKRRGPPLLTDTTKVPQHPALPKVLGWPLLQKAEQKSLGSCSDISKSNSDFLLIQVLWHCEDGRYHVASNSTVSVPSYNWFQLFKLF